MMVAMPDSPPLTPELLVWAYTQGLFPMAGSREADEVGWYSPDPRAILPLDGFNVSRSLRRRVRRGDYPITRNRAFERVIRHCARPRRYEGETWINPEIIEAYTQLHRRGAAHSVEAWEQGGETPGHDGAEGDLVGGLYGVALGGAFFGESMFSDATDASKVCLVHLVTHLCQQGFTLLDVQFTSPETELFGVIEVPREQYLSMLRSALRQDVRWS